MKVMQAQKKMDMKKLLEQEKMELHHQIKRRIALETIVSALEVRAINGYGIYVYMHGEGGVCFCILLYAHCCFSSLLLSYVRTYILSMFLRKRSIKQLWQQRYRLKSTGCWKTNTIDRLLC